MKLVILLSVVALCYAVPFPMKSIDFTEDGKIIITEPTGKRVTIHKAVGPMGKKNIEISVEGPNFPVKTVHIDDDAHKIYMAGMESTTAHEVDKRSSKTKTSGASQYDVIDEILKEFQGAVSDKEYEKLLSKVYKYVKNGDVDPAVYEMLCEMAGNSMDSKTGIYPGYQTYSDWMKFKMGLIGDKISSKTPFDTKTMPYDRTTMYNRPMYSGYDRAMYGTYDRPIHGYDTPVYGGYDRPVYGGYDRPISRSYDRPTYGGYERPISGGYDRPTTYGGYDRPMYGYDRTMGYERPTYGGYHYGPYTHEYMSQTPYNVRSGYEGYPHPYYTRPVNA